MVFEWGWPPAHDKGEKRSRSKVLEAVCVRVLCAVHVFFVVHFEAFSDVDHIILCGSSGSRAVDQHSFFADSDSAVFLNSDPDQASKSGSSL